MKINRLNLGRLFYNNKIVLVFSIMLAFICWVALSTSSTETSTKLITDIPITVPLSENAQEIGLTVFGLDDIKAEIAVSGNRLILGQLTKNDILVTAQQSANMINSIGKYTLELSVKKNSLLTDYEFANTVSPKFITVVVDRHQSSDFDIIPNIKYNADTDYFIAPVALSDSTVNIAGPESVVSSIAKVTVEGNVPGTLNKSTNLNKLPINLFDNAGNKINTKNLTMSVTKVDANITVLKQKHCNIKPTFESAPIGLNVKHLIAQLSPTSVEIATPNESFNNIKEIELEPINFSEINLNHYQFERALKIPADCRNLNNISSSKVKLNLSGFQSRIVTSGNISFKNVPSDKSASSHTANLSVQVIGPASQVRNVNPSDINIEVDLSGKESFTGRTEMPAKITFSVSANKCWAYGNHSVNVSIAKK